MTGEEIKEWERKIDAMSREEMCRLYRFAEPGHPCFLTDSHVTLYFSRRFHKLGGFSPAISKRLGWDK